MGSKKRRIELLVGKLMKGQISTEEENELNNWYNQNQDSPIEIPSDFAGSEKELGQRILDSVQKCTDSKPIVKLWPRIAVAASIVICIAFGFYFYQKSQIISTEITAKNDIPPGKIGATLTLANGKKILLSNVSIGILDKETGVKIIKSANGQLIYEVSNSPSSKNRTGKLNYNTLTTARGEQYQVRLPDSSIVWLNAASALKYPTSFTSLKDRRVELSGEAYFQIAKDKQHPFIVSTNKQDVEVLGTHFNINSYTDEPIVKTTLLEGSVKVTSNTLSSNRESWVLIPGQQSQITSKGISIINNVDQEEVLAWKNGYFKFNENLESIMNKVARWYNVEIIYQNKPNAQLTFGGEISRSKNISSVLDIIALTGNVHFKIEGRKVIVMK